MSIIADFFLKSDYAVTLINDVLPSGSVEYFVDPRIRRVYLDNEKTTPVNKTFNRINRLRKLIKREKPDAVLSFLGPPNIRMLISAFGLRVRKVVSVRNDPNKEYGKGVMKFVSRAIFRLADGCVFQTEEASLYFPKAVRRKSVIIANPVGEKFFCENWTGDRKEIAVVGRLQPQKNPLLALKAFNIIAGRFPEYKLVYYGDGELKKDVLEKSALYGLSDRVVVYGKTADIEKKLASSSVFLMSSDYEGMPNALLEAIAVGVPAVSTDCPCGGPKMIIENPEQGTLVSVGDERGMAEAVIKLLEDAELRRRMSDAEKRRAEAFRTEVIMEKWRSFIESR